MFGLFAKRPDSPEVFSGTELAALKGPRPTGWEAWAVDELHLYRALVREIFASNKIKKFNSGERRGDILVEKVIHFMHRYHGVYAVTPPRFELMLQAAWTRVYGEGKYPRSIVKPLFEVGMGTGSGTPTWADLIRKKDVTGTRGADAAYYASLAANKGLQYFKELDKAAGAGTGGALSIVNGVRTVRILFKAVDRQVVASEFMSRYPEAPASVEFDSYDDTPYMDQVLGFVAAYALNQSRRLARRKATEAIGAGVSAAGGIATATGVGAAVGAPLLAVGLLIGMETTVEELVRAAWKAAHGTKGVARHEAATLLWLNGAAGHAPSIEFMAMMGMLPVVELPRSGDAESADRDVGDGTDGGAHFVELGYFTPAWFDDAVARIMRKLRTV
ncbi:MAG: hypothetical protein RL653_969 [Pseudomonadota bacterium]|jgi:hypothetical protein